ncbi:MAG: ECF-type riboflavin transporter substrate-binding protein [Lachnospiraceae bacterium]|nr:ECF-type riboflavin transporter substrate-binding protein [Lachnospiraceae bacterium]
MFIKESGTVTVAAIILGSLLFFILGRFVSIPCGIPDTYITLQYGVLAFAAAVFGPLAGALIGLLGHFAVDYSGAVYYGWNLWWSWIISSAFFGGAMGFANRKTVFSNDYLDIGGIVQFNVTQIIVNLISWVVLAPLLDVLLYGQLFEYVFKQGVISAGVNIITTAVLGSLLCIAYSSAVSSKSQSQSVTNNTENKND